MKVLAAAAVSVALLTTASYAADAPEVYVDPVVSMASDWDGFYLGAGVIAETAAAPTPAENVVGLQGIAGFNATFDSFLIGGEAYVMPWWSNVAGGGISVGALARIGVLVTEDVLVYGAVGGEVTNGGGTFGTLGGGVEFMVTEDVSLDLEYKHYFGSNGDRYHHVGVSANWHF
jgi:opacity protein-like surface antigen